MTGMSGGVKFHEHEKLAAAAALWKDSACCHWGFGSCQVRGAEYHVIAEP